MKYSKELHELVKTIRDGYVETGNNEFTVTKVTFALLDEIERLQAERRWIPVSERLPESNGAYVLIVDHDLSDPDDYPLVAIGFYGEDSKAWFYDDAATSAQVTHWMPLPEPPDAS